MTIEIAGLFKEYIGGNGYDMQNKNEGGGYWWVVAMNVQTLYIQDSGKNILEISM